MESRRPETFLLEKRLEREREARRDAEQLAEKAIRELCDALTSARAAERAKGELLASLSHEIRTPLNAIIGLTEILLRDGPRPAQLAYLGTLMDSGEALLGVVDDVLEYARLEAGTLELASVPFELQRPIDEALETLAANAKDKGVALRGSVDPTLPARLVGDPDQLRQLLIHLVGNAIKFTEKGEVSVRVEREASGDFELLHFSVRDTGIGVDPEHLDRIFEAFEQMDEATKLRYGGSGLGLSICRKLVEQMGGQLGVESTPGGGSIFHFTARFGRPAASGAMSEREPPAKAAPPVLLRLSLAEGHDVFVLDDGREVYVPPQRILLVEDSVANQKVALAMLREHLHMVTVADNGRRALEALERQEFDLVLMDIELPGMDGLATTAAIRAREARSGAPRLPIIAMTARALDGDRAQCLEAGMNDYVAKPVRREAMLAAIRRVVGFEQRGRVHELQGDAELSRLDAPPQSLVDWSVPLARVDGNREVLRDLVGSTVQEIREHLARLPEPIASGDAGEVRRRAYTLKGSMRTFGAVKPYQLAQELEKVATSSAAPDVAKALFEHLRASVEPVLPELERFVETGEMRTS